MNGKDVVKCLSNLHLVNTNVSFIVNSQRVQSVLHVESYSSSSEQTCILQCDNKAPNPQEKKWQHLLLTTILQIRLKTAEMCCKVVLFITRAFCALTNRTPDYLLHNSDNYCVSVESHYNYSCDTGPCRSSSH